VDKTAAATHRTETIEVSPRFASMKFEHLSIPSAKDSFSKSYSESVHAKVLALERDSTVRTSAVHVAVTGVRGGSVIMDTRVHVTLPAGAEPNVALCVSWLCDNLGVVVFLRPTQSASCVCARTEQP